MRSATDEIWDADLPLEICEQAEALHDNGPTKNDADALGVLLGEALAGTLPEDAGLLDLLPDQVADEMQASAEDYESLLLSAAAEIYGMGKDDMTAYPAN